MEEQKNDNPPSEAIARGYETTEFRLRWLWTFVVGLVVAAVVCHFVMKFVMHATSKQFRDADVPQSTVAQIARPTFAPSLQPTPMHDRAPAEDLALLHDHEDSIFSQLGWKRYPERGVFRPPADLVRAVAKRASSPATTQATGGAR